MEIQQRVVYSRRSKIQAWCEVVRGVLQGSVLGPLLFTLFTNDLPNVIENYSVNLCADDTAIYFSSKNPLKVQKIQL